MNEFDNNHAVKSCLSTAGMSRRKLLKMAGLGAASLPFWGSSALAMAESLKGANINVEILGLAGWPPSAMSTKIGNTMFAPYAQKKLGYQVHFSSAQAPFEQLFQKAATSLATHSAEYNLLISDSQWLGAFATPGWILKLNDIIDQNPDLNIDWYSDIVTDGYMAYPQGEKSIYGLPQEGDVMVMYVRKDMLEDPKEKAAFQKKYNKKLPQTFDEFEALTWDDYKDVMAFFTRPDKNLYGIGLQYAKTYDNFSCYYYPFVFSKGQHIWNPKTRNVQGILNTEQNAKSLEEFVALQKYCPPGSNQVGIPELADLFTKGKVFSCIQWAAMGPTMIPDDLRGKVMVVPPPAFQVNGEKKRTYTLGGQPWVINAFNSKEQLAAVIDFLKYWYAKDTQLEFAKRGGNPCVKSVLESDGFDDIQPWFRAYKYMLSEGRTKDFWHDPNYAKMLDVQQEAFTAYAAGNAKDPKQVLDYIAYQQQKILHDAGETKQAPKGPAPSLS
ncbi:extracellular solute-binding protein [Salinisphaera sp. LB1]|uniref:extracellular solute-binding protein n=1 Tax=Salinisphaera sp. LB1 TaxID=2183911 RepID=UPI000D706CCB|nr:extracellular solute-binding protein [Salinisphaera sp. LB1]AWN15418.1 Maltose/maltodextrin ABC transporter, substrate binding periplasmic protein MalE [Salinisphaera sp. LB1]